MATRHLLLTAALVVAVSSPTLSAEALPTWGFDRDGDAEGWQPLNDIREMEVRDGSLHLRMGARDPYLWTGEVPLNLPTTGIAGVAVRMRTSVYGLVQVYWVTDGSPEWYGPDRKRLTCKLIGDGAWHTYRIRLDRHPGWAGALTRLRLDPVETIAAPDAEVTAEIDHVRFYAASGQGTTVVSLSRPVAERGRPFRLWCRLYNDGAQPVSGASAELTVPDGLALPDGSLAQVFPTVAPGQASAVSWELSASSAGIHDLSVTVRGGGADTALTRRVYVSERPATYSARRDVVLANSRVRVTFVRNSFGYGHCHFARYDPASRHWLLLAQLCSFSRLVAGRREADCDVYADECELLKPAPRVRSARFRTTATDGAGVPWDMAFRFSLAEGSDLLEVRYTATPRHDTKLYRLEGPMLRVGEGSFGVAKDAAIFPGLEFLERGQGSSSLRDFTNEWRFRMAPHPYRITIPAMSVTHQGSTVGLLWDMQQRWDGAEALPTAHFASPNAVTGFPAWTEQGEHHLLGLSLPPVPRYVPENHELAEEPYSAKAGRPLTLTAQVLLAESDDPTYAVQRWIADRGLPPPAPHPRPLEASLDLCRRAYLETLWSPEQRGWKPYPETKEYGNSAWVELLLRLDALTTSRPEVRKALLARVAEVAPTRVEGPVGSDISWSKAPYFLGLFDGDTLSHLEARARDAIRRQQPDGSWHYIPLPLPEGFETCPPLGGPDMQSVYQTGAEATNVLRWANISGDAQALAAGLKALDFLSSRQVLVPQGAPFEDPAISPYLWSSGLAVAAFLQGYEATGEARYLDGARYWARTGLTFVYLWNLPGVPLQRYATIGVFGSSYYEHANWIGRPVQWLGLEYAYELRHLATVDRGFPWATVADGITTSALYQLATGGPNLGTYPDSVEGAGDTAAPGFRDMFGVWIQPDLILFNLLAARGMDPDIHVRTVRAGDREVRVSSAARIEAAQMTPQGLTLGLAYLPGEAVCTVIAGLSEPRQVLCQGRELAERPSPREGREGWMYDARRHLIYVKMDFARPRLRLECKLAAN
jgi:hypothetical protein